MSSNFTLRLEQLFSGQIPEQWMRGEIDTDTVLRGHLVPGASPELVSFLHSTVIKECARFAMRRRLVKLLAESRQHSMLVLATDNMDCFTAAIDARKDMARLFDDYLSSSDIGALKEDSEQFFAPWLRAYDINPSAAVLIDDNETNCTAFEAFGGQPILFDGSPRCWSQIEALSQQRRPLAAL